MCFIFRCIFTMKSGQNIKLVTRAVKICLDQDETVIIGTRNQENAENLAELIDWLGYGKMVTTKVEIEKTWQVVINKRIN